MVWLLLGLHSDWTNVANNEDIINLVINPPIHIHATGSAKEKIKVHASIQIALTLETIWNFRNQVVHNDAKPNILTTIKALENRILEHVDAHFSRILWKTGL